MADGEDITTCLVCFEDYTEMGDHIPRLLPCTHTICQKCLCDLVRGKNKKSLRCPECRRHHQAQYGLRSFPQNKYVLAHIKTTKQKFEKCQEHDAELSLFCKNTKCRKAICQLCMIKHHKVHDVVDMREELKKKHKTIISMIDTISSDIQVFKSGLISAQAKITSKHESCVALLKKTKIQHVKQIFQMYDRMIQQALNNTSEVTAKLQQDTTVVDENLALMHSLNQTVNESTTTHQEMDKNLELLLNMPTKIQASLSNTGSYQYYEYECSMEGVGKGYGNLVLKELPAMVFEARCAQRHASRFKYNGTFL